MNETIYSGHHHTKHHTLVTIKLWWKNIS